MSVEPWISETYLGSTVPQYLAFFGIVGAGALLGRSLSFVYRRRIVETVEATDTDVDDVIVHALGRPVVLLGVVLAVAVGRTVLTPVEPLRSVLAASVEIPVVVAIAWIAVRLTDGLIDTYVKEYADRTESKLDDELVPIVSRMTNIAIASIAGIVILDSIGYDVTAIIASLGVVSVAVAFASRKTMADIFGGAHILATNPFRVDDVVEIDGTRGTVEDIGLRTTRIRDFDGRAVTFPNSTIAATEVTNVTSEPTRRITTYLGLSYETPPAQMEAALDLVEETVNAVDGIDTGQTRALFWDYGESAVRIRLDYYVDAKDRWMEVKDQVNRGIQQAFEDAGLKMAFPTRTVRLEGESTDLDPVSSEEGVDTPS